jgi:hypothetical protein
MRQTCQKGHEARDLAAWRCQGWVLPRHQNEETQLPIQAYFCPPKPGGVPCNGREERISFLTVNPPDKFMKEGNSTFFGEPIRITMALYQAVSTANGASVWYRNTQLICISLNVKTSPWTWEPDPKWDYDASSYDSKCGAPQWVHCLAHLCSQRFSGTLVP